MFLCIMYAVLYSCVSGISDMYYDDEERGSTTTHTHTTSKTASYKYRAK